MKKSIMGLVACATVGLAAQAQALTCARMYEHSDFRGEVLVVEVGDEVENIGNHWNDRISSIKVTETCVLTVWEDQRYGGQYDEWEGNNRSIEGWNDAITSYTCYCEW